MEVTHMYYYRIYTIDGRAVLVPGHESHEFDINPNAKLSGVMMTEYEKPIDLIRDLVREDMEKIDRAYDMVYELCKGLDDVKKTLESIE